MLNLQEVDNTFVGIQAFIPNPDYSQVTASMTGTLVFGKTGTPDVDIDGWTALSIRPTVDSTCYYNLESTKTKTLPANTETVVWVGQDNVDSVTLVLGAGTAEVQGM